MGNKIGFPGKLRDNLKIFLCPVSSLPVVSGDRWLGLAQRLAEIEKAYQEVLETSMPEIWLTFLHRLVLISFESRVKDWHKSYYIAAAYFTKIKETVQFPGQGLPGRCWTSGKSVQGVC